MSKMSWDDAMAPDPAQEGAELPEGFEILSPDIVSVAVAAATLLPQPPEPIEAAIGLPNLNWPLGHILRVKRGGNFDDVSAAERAALRATMRGEFGILVVGPDAAAVHRVSDALHRMWILDDGGGWSGTA